MWSCSLKNTRALALDYFNRFYLQVKLGTVATIGPWKGGHTGLRYYSNSHLLKQDLGFHQKQFGIQYFSSVFSISVRYSVFQFGTWYFSSVLSISVRYSVFQFGTWYFSSVLGSSIVNEVIRGNFRLLYFFFTKKFYPHKKHKKHKMLKKRLSSS